MRKLETEVIVVAAGAAGLAAAVSAAEAGAKVIVFEKASTVGGAGNMAGGPFAVESRVQRIRKIGISREEAFKIHMDYVHWRADARLVRAFIDKSASTIEWLEKVGVEFGEVSCHNFGFNFTWHLIKGTGKVQFGYGGVTMKALADRAKALGAAIFLRTTVKKILKEGGRIAGVMVEDESGETIQAKGKAVIVATGGFGDNPEWIKKYTGYDWGKDFFSIRIPGTVGDGIRMAWEAGAAPTETIMEMTPMGIPELANDLEAGAAFNQPNLLVNLLGERFVSEELFENPAFLGNAMSRQKNRCAFSIFDGAIKKLYEKNKFDYLPQQTLTENWEASGLPFDAQLKHAFDQGAQNLFVADSLEELAAKMNVNQEAFKKTVKEYNRSCETGRDELFNKNARYLKPIKEPKFYAGRLFPASIGSLGGIKINYKTEAMTKDHDVVPGLYAAGNDANALYGDTYAYLLPGNTLGFALNSGRIAGENAAEYTRFTGK